MARPLRYAEPWQLTELTNRTFQGRHLLRPSPRLNTLIVGILALARERFDVRIYGFVFLSNHFHMIAAARTPAELSRFMCFVMSNIAREIGRLHGWSGHFWAGRYHSIPIVDREALIGRMRYLFENGCKEGLVSHPSQWEGLQVVDALTNDAPLEGIWIDRTAIHQARKRVGQKVEERDFTTSLRLTLDVLPIWEDLSVEDRQATASELVEEAAESFPGPRHGRVAVRTRPRSPHHRPARMKRSCAPLCHASTEALRAAFEQAYRCFVERYRGAAAILKSQLTELGFPAHAQVLAGAVPTTG